MDKSFGHVRFYEIDSGKITVDGFDLKKLDRAVLRKNIGIVQQDVFVFILLFFGDIHNLAKTFEARRAFLYLLENVYVVQGEINADIESAVSGMRVSRAYGAEQHENEKFEKGNEKFSLKTRL